MSTKVKKILKDERFQIAICFSFFLFMMVFNLMHSALWGDEWVEYRYSQKAIKSGAMYKAIIKTFQPPLYNFVMHFWLKISQSIVWFRFFNVVIGFITAIFIYATNSKLYSKKVGLISISALAVCYQWVYCIQECSEYALMLTCLSISIYFYVSCSQRFSYPTFLGFVLFSVLAIYSQYGTVFVTIPLLTLFFIKIVFDKKEQLKRKNAVFGIYAFSFIAFAVPLYVFFLSKQLANNEIAENAVHFSGDLLRDIPFAFGQIIGYLYGMYAGSVWPVIFSVMSVTVLALGTIVIFNTKSDWTKKSIIITLILGYVLHYVLVQLHIYAMVHPNESGGIFARYSYFYIPICCVAFPIIVGENIKIFMTETGKLIRYAAGMLIVPLLFVSFTNVMKNWNKTYEDVYIKIWEENEGWKDYTYLYGVKYGFYYYVKTLDNYDESYLKKVKKKVNDEKLPKRFWAWRINWGGDGWQTTIDKARSLGYTVTVYDDRGFTGQLAYCVLEE